MKSVLFNVLSIVIIYNIANAQLSGPLSGTITPGEYTVINDISVEEADSLIIEPDATFLFEGDYDFDIYGYLYCVGTVMDSIVFKRHTGAGGWGGVDFYDLSSDSNRLEYCLIEGSIHTGIDCWDCSPTFKYCTIEGNTGFMGAGVCLSNADPLFEDCIISNNVCSRYGGGISFFGSNANFIGCAITGNIVDNGSSITAYGGGCYISGGIPLLDACTISQNQAGSITDGIGGGVFTTYAEPSLLNCIISENAAGQFSYGDGGGIYFLESSATVYSCTLENNTAKNMGGGMFNEFSNISILNSMIIGNTAENGDGGGIRCYNCNLIIQESVISNNSAFTDGGGVRNLSSTLNMTECTVYGNSANDFGGAIHGDDGFIKNSIISGNMGYCGIYSVDESLSMNYNDFWDNQNGNFGGTIPPEIGMLVSVNANGDSCDAYSNIYQDPLFYAIAGDSAFYLNSNSPCIDAGDPTSQPDPDNTIADMGAFYFDQSLGLKKNGNTAIINEHFILSAYPNPFNPSTKISFSLPAASYVILTVYNLLGEIVEELVGGTRNAGIHEVTWVASQGTSGIYFVKLSAGELQQTKKLMFIK